MIAVVAKVPDEVRWYTDEKGERQMGCPKCKEPMIRGSTGMICTWCNYTVELPKEEKRYRDIRRMYGNKDKALTLLLMAYVRIFGSGMLGSMIDRNQIGPFQDNELKKSVTWAHQVLGDLAPIWNGLDPEDHILLGHWAPVVATQAEDKSVDPRILAMETGRTEQAIQKLAEYRLELFRGAHKGKQPSRIRAILIHGLEARNLHRYGYCRRCGKWYESKPGPHGLIERERCHGARVRWGIVVSEDRIDREIGGAVSNWSRALRKEKLI